MASDSPESLMTICTDFCLRNLEGTLCYLLDNEILRLHPDIFLPSEICDRLVNEYIELVNADSSFEPHESFFTLFSEPQSTRLTRLHLREDIVQDQDLEAIRKQVSKAWRWQCACLGACSECCLQKHCAGTVIRNSVALQSDV
ncbi:hypothetical protein FKM82_005576 [Ascaphus truei]